MNKQSGFSMVEFLCYIALSLIVVCLLSTVTMHIYTTGIKQGYTDLQLGDVYGTCLLLAEDIAKAPDEAFWKEISVHLLVWRTGNKDYGWLFKDGSLYTVRGVYDVQTKKFSSSRKTLMLRGLTMTRFDRLPTQRGLLIEGNIAFKRGTHEQKIRLLGMPRSRKISHT